MELEKHEKKISAKYTIKEKLTLHPTHGQQFGKRDIQVTSPLSFLSTEPVPSGESGTRPLTFTFVPSIGQLPTHFQVVDVCELVRTSEEPNNESSQEIINRSTVGSDDLALKSGIRQDSESTYHTGTSQKIFRPKGCNTSKGEMQESDLFKAEFVFITDSDEGDEETVGRNNVQQPSVGHGTGHARCQLLATSHISSGGESSKPHGDLNVPETQCAALSHSTTRSPKQRQLTSPSTFDHLFHKPPAACLISPTKLKVECDIVNPKQVSSLEESYSKWQSAARPSKQDSSTCFQATAHSSPLYMPQRSPSVLNSPSSSTQFSNNLQMPNIVTPNYVYKMSEFTASSVPSKSPAPVSYFPNSAGTPGSPDQPVSPCSSKRFNTFFATPVYITAHSLSPSPKPLSSPFFGSSSTICSINEPCSRMSSSGNLLKSGIRSPLPTRLSLLTAILKSGPSQQRPLSPASCPPTFSPNSLRSSTLTIDQKFKTSPPTPKKSASSFSIRSNSPSQEEHWPLLFSHSPIPVPLSSNPISAPRARSLSPKKHLHARTLSPDSLYPLSSTISSYRKRVVSPLLQPKSSSELPPVPKHSSSLNPAISPTKLLPYPVHKTQRPEKSRRVHTYSPTFTCKSYPLSSPANEKGTFSPILEKCSSSSPNLLHPTYKSKAGSSQLSAQELNPVSPTPSNVSTHWSSSPPNSTSPIWPLYNVHSHSPQLNSSSLHPKHRVYSSAARPKQLPTISVPPCRSPVPGQSPCTPLSRSRELSSPKCFSRPPDHESLKPKQYKIKTSYKAFAAIPTNTLLMEQKALEEPIKTEKVTEDTTLDTHSELLLLLFQMCSPAQLRQKTEELCAAIDQVLQDPLPMMSATLQRAAGRETRYANLYLPTPSVTESQLTKPGVIRPGPVKTKILLKTEEPNQPNPFKKYLEETRDPDIEQDNAPLHPLYPTKLIPPTKSHSHPQSICHADCLTPGPFSHLSSILCDVHESSYRPYSHNALYNKPSHPIVPIPENEALSSKEFHSVAAPSKSDLPLTCESKKTSKGKLPVSESPLCSECFSLRVDMRDTPAKTS
ncbi:muscular LMNA-interacting protein isoform X5 [Gopherus flavomarginatus]|uniref:muscular LMNA-interacting protein isoform X5 n=1 Tax=Gopherus flavomarginatus TaxID=286002 RepID=UPI0021CBD93D|nr:muscular LMNA-interacting protein isoform X5 [Gopherus flavomarginatus]